MKIWSTMKIEGRFTAEIDVPDTNPETIKRLWPRRMRRQTSVNCRISMDL